MPSSTGSSKPRILVVGSSNTDLVVYCQRLPKPGETVLGGEFKMFGGGKGANQAVAAVRAGGDVTFLGAYGADRFGDEARERLVKEGIRVDYFRRVTEAPSGIALILVDGVTRDNLIAVAKSANEAVDAAMISAARSAFEAADVVISQLEIRDEAVNAVAQICNELKKPLILNPAPTRALAKTIYESVDIFVVNEHEVRTLSGIENIEAATAWFQTQGCRVVVVTLGADGATFVSFSDGKQGAVPPPKVTPVDTTGAGDCFVGWLGVGIAEGLNLEQSVQRAVKAASLKTTRPGAQHGMPYRDEVVG
ncbi:MAG: ribokinase [Verrucomicrobia bacterium]|nr:ribokinase [Verrucomicrobiota bacterium]MBV8483344.1 ribokinase [Verrucomicrobiota bacterium]